MIRHHLCLNHQVSERNKDPISKSARGHSCDTLVKNLTEFCLHPENLHEAEFKSNRPINIVGGISGRYNIKCVTFFLLIILMQIYTEKEQQVGQKEVKKMCDLERKVH